MTLEVCGGADQQCSTNLGGKLYVMLYVVAVIRDFPMYSS